MPEIGVSELCNVSGISRSTFYRLFDTPLDLLDYACDTYVKKTIADYPEEVFKSNDDFVMFSLMYWKNHSDLLEAAVHCGRLDIISRTLEAHSSKLIPMFEQKFTEYEMAYLKAGAAGMIASLLSLWIERGKKESPTQIFELYRKLSLFKGF